jgi:hypothetical protein
MNDQDLRDGKELLGRALGTEPPLWTARDEVVRRGRRVVRRRKLAVSGGVVAGVVAVLVGAVALTSTAGGTGAPVAPAGSAGLEPPPANHTKPTTTPAVPVLPSDGGTAPGSPVPGADLPRPGTQRAQAEVERLAGVLPNSPPALTANVTAHPSGLSVVDGGWHVEYCLDAAGSDRLLMVDLWPTATRDTLDCTGAQSGRPMPGCATSTLENGTSLRMLTEESPGEGLPTLRSVVARRPDGTSVFVLETGTSREPLLTFAQLTDLAVLPQLAVHW